MKKIGWYGMLFISWRHLLYLDSTIALFLTLVLYYAKEKQQPFPFTLLNDHLHPHPNDEPTTR